MRLRLADAKIGRLNVDNRRAVQVRAGLGRLLCGRHMGLLGVTLAECWASGLVNLLRRWVVQSGWPVEGLGGGEPKESSAHPCGSAAAVTNRLRNGQPAVLSDYFGRD